MLSYHGTPMSELISCILATGNRERFVPQALRCFVAQTYPHRELVVVDDGEVPVGRLCRATPGVRYLRLDRRTPTGTKLNLGIEAARGSILQKIDDDDYYAPRFLATAAERLQASRSARAIAGWDCFLILLAAAARPALFFSGHGWLAGGTLCFRRAVWEAAPFRDVAKDEDAYFLEDHAGPRVRIRAPEQYVLVRHGRNTWRRFRNGAGVEGFVRTLERYPKPIPEVMGEEAARFYTSLRGLTRSAAV
jgi:glycosyltransferase involved in cell wall biosynthesis